MTLRSPPRSPRSRPSTSLSHGAAHKPLQRPGGADAERRERRQAPKAPLAIDREKGQRLVRAHGRRRGPPILSGTMPTMRRAASALKAAENGKEAAPADGCDEKLGRCRGRDGAQGAQHDEPAVGEGEALGGKPEHDGLEAGHQGQRDPDPDQRAAEHQADELSASANRRAPALASKSRPLLKRARAVAVEQDAAGELHGGKHQKIDGGQAARGRPRSSRAPPSDRRRSAR